MPMIPDIKHIYEAHERIIPYIRETPILESSLLNNWLGHRILFKAECMQKTGAFKARGACNTITKLMQQKSTPKKIITNSSGNHAQAVAWAAAQFDIPATIYMPADVSLIKAQATNAYGAEIILCKDRFEVDHCVNKASHEKNNLWIPPYNHMDVIYGQGTTAFECLQQPNNQVNAIFAPCGGGGLLSGTLITTKNTDRKIQVIGVEPAQANDAAESRRNGKIQKLNTPSKTIADGVRTPSLGGLTFPFIQQLDAFYEVSEQQIIYWTQWLQHLLKLHIEPTSAMTMAGVVKWLKNKTTTQTALVILSGGNIDQPTMKKIWSKNHLNKQPGF